MSTGRHVVPLNHIIWTQSQPVLLLNAATLTEKQ